MSDEKRVAETALVRTVDEERELLEKQRLKTERKELRKTARMAELTTLVARVKLDAARVVDLRRHMFKDEEELTAAGLTSQQKRIVRQFEEPKKATAFGVESAAKLIEAETRAQKENGRVNLNIENAVIQLPEKKDDATKPVIIDIVPGEK